MRGEPVVVEICAEGFASALAAEAGGADRVELCEALAVGGLTPPLDEVAETRRRIRIPVRVLIRPRAGGFAYDREEFEAMGRSIDAIKTLGASGVVLGVNLADGRVDRTRTRALVERAWPLGVTFHKAFDALVDPWQGLEDLVALGVDRVLTSGGAETARDGVGRLASLVRRAAGRVAVMAGGRLTESDLPALRAAGLSELHVGSAVQTAGVTDAAKVRAFVTAARREWEATEPTGAGARDHESPRAREPL